MNKSSTISIIFTEIFQLLFIEMMGVKVETLLAFGTVDFSFTWCISFFFKFGFFLRYFTLSFNIILGNMVDYYDSGVL